MIDIRETRKSLDFLMNSVSEISKVSGVYCPTPVPKLSLDFDSGKKEETVSKETYDKIYKTVKGVLDESEDYVSLSMLSHKVYQRGIRPQVTPEQFVQLVLRAVNDVNCDDCLEIKPHVEGTLYRRKNVKG